ncbi:sodium:proton antiporter [candidate division KSB1 bacterium]|nr:sodium:proton antiporter [candidate division KSB1 bacterium]
MLNKRTFLLILSLGLSTAALATENTAHADSALGSSLPIWSGLPFLGILLSIALFPLFAPKFWHHHYPKISILWALFLAVPFIMSYGYPAVYEVLHIYLVDYIPFIILLWALFTVAGGILIEGTIKGTPTSNTILMLIGTLIASWIGTTGASMLLIRPVIRANASRKSKVHIVVFFIFLVSNIGGSLTPLGDPPLLLGFLHLVPFFWTMHLLPEMSVVVLILLALFYAIDSLILKRDIREGHMVPVVEESEKKPLRFRGTHNLLFLLGIIGGVLMSGVLHLGFVSVYGVHVELQNILRDVILISMGLLSLITTSKAIREANEFNWAPIKEVAYLFAGIFMTIVPALAMLKAGTQGALGFIIEAVKEPWHYFWITGALSSFLDNAPTYLTFLNTALGNFFPGVTESEAVARLIAEQGIYLIAISCGAVFMGANTYIGNAPNFMVRSIAEEQGIRMPSFFGYMGYSIVILLPVFVLITLLFFL